MLQLMCTMANHLTKDIHTAILHSLHIYAFLTILYILLLAKSYSASEICWWLCYCGRSLNKYSIKIENIKLYIMWHLGLLILLYSSWAQEGQMTTWYLWFSLLVCISSCRRSTLLPQFFMDLVSISRFTRLYMLYHFTCTSIVTLIWSIKERNGKPSSKVFFRWTKYNLP